MAAQFLGQFLVEKNLITADQLLQASLYQQKHNRLVGEIAVERGEMTPEQVEGAKAEQRRRDIYFGDAAVALGYLNQAQVDALLLAQKQTHVFIGEALVKLGFISEEALAKALSLFKSERPSQGANRRVISFPDVPHRECMELMVEMTQKSLMRLCGVHSHISGQNAVKRGGEIPLFKWSACIGLHEPWRGCFVITASDRVAEAIAQKQRGAMGELIKPDGAALDSAIKELATMAVRLAEGPIQSRGLALRAGAPEAQPRSFALRGSNGLVVEFVTLLGALHVALTYP